jgi:DNA mismatch repair protein MutS
MADLTPMMRQYLEIKEQNKDSILFFRRLHSSNQTL